MARCFPGGMKPVFDEGGYAKCSPNAIDPAEGRKSFPSGEHPFTGSQPFASRHFVHELQLHVSFCECYCCVAHHACRERRLTILPVLHLTPVQVRGTACAEIHHIFHVHIQGSLKLHNLPVLYGARVMNSCRCRLVKLGSMVRLHCRAHLMVDLGDGLPYLVAGGQVEVL